MFCTVTDELLLAITTKPFEAIRLSHVGYVAGVVVIPFPHVMTGCLKGAPFKLPSVDG